MSSIDVNRTSVDVNRMNIARDALCNILILPMIKLVIYYAMYSEEEKVRIVFDNIGEELFWGNFWTDEDEWENEEWMGICVNPPSLEVAIQYGISDWKEGDQNVFSLGFGGHYDAYTPTIKVSIADLLPSKELSSITIHTVYKDIFRQCRPQYVKKMQAAIDEI